MRRRSRRQQHQREGERRAHSPHDQCKDRAALGRLPLEAHGRSPEIACGEVERASAAGVGPPLVFSLTSYDTSRGAPIVEQRGKVGKARRTTPQRPAGAYRPARSTCTPEGALDLRGARGATATARKTERSRPASAAAGAPVDSGPPRSTDRCHCGREPEEAATSSDSAALRRSRRKSLKASRTCTTATASLHSLGVRHPAAVTRPSFDADRTVADVTVRLGGQYVATTTVVPLALMSRNNCITSPASSDQGSGGLVGEDELRLVDERAAQSRHAAARRGRLGGTRRSDAAATPPAAPGARDAAGGRGEARARAAPSSRSRRPCGGARAPKSWKTKPTVRRISPVHLAGSSPRATCR